MALTDQAEVERQLGRELTDEELATLPGLLDEASDLVLGYLGLDTAPDPVPDAVARATASMVVAVYTRPASVPLNAEQQNAGIYGVRYTTGSTSGSPWLSNAIKMRLDPYRTGMVTMSMVSERNGYSGDDEVGYW